MDGLITFFASHYALRAETVLKRGGLRAKLVAGPRDLSPNCGVALRFEYGDREHALGLLEAQRVQIDSVHKFVPRTDVWRTAEVPAWRR
jgi:Putative Se/S carrier protein-like